MSCTGSDIFQQALPLSEVSSTTTTARKQLDAFGLERASTKIVVFEYTGKYDSGPLLFETVVSGTGSSTFVALSGANTLSTGGTASGASCIRQSHVYIIYVPGKARQAIIGMNCGAVVTNASKRVGMFDTNEGIYFEQKTAGISFIVRSKITGSIVEQEFLQSAWTLDKLDGTGSSGYTLDATKPQALVIEWVGYNIGYIRLGFFIAGVVVYVTEISQLNNISSFSIGSSTLPVRYEVTNTGIASGIATLNTSSCIVYDEDGQENQFSYTFNANMGITAKAVTTILPLISIRPKASFNGIVNRSRVKMADITTLVKTNDALIEIWRGGTLTGAAWSSVDSNSVTEFDIAATILTGGIKIDSFYQSAASGSTTTTRTEQVDSKIALFNDYAGTSPDILTITARSITATSNVLTSLQFLEQR